MSKIPVNVIIRQNQSTFFTEIYSLKNNKYPLFKKEEPSLLHAHQTVTSFVQKEYNIVDVSEILENKEQISLSKQNPISFSSVTPHEVSYQFAWAEFKNTIEQWVSIEHNCTIALKMEKMPPDEDGVLGNIHMSFDEKQTKQKEIQQLTTHYSNLTTNTSLLEEENEIKEMYLISCILCDLFKCSNVRLQSDSLSKNVSVFIPFHDFSNSYQLKKRK